MKKTVHIFNCSTHKSLFGLTYDQIGSDLPREACKGQWQKFQTIHISDTDPILFSGLEPKDILEKLDADGYLIYEVKIISNWTEIG